MALKSETQRSEKLHAATKIRSPRAGPCFPTKGRVRSLSIGLAPSRRRKQSPERAIVQPDGIALAVHGETQHRARKLVGAHRRVPGRFERQPCLVKRSLDENECLRIEGRSGKSTHRFPHCQRRISALEEASAQTWPSCDGSRSASR